MLKKLTDPRCILYFNGKSISGLLIAKTNSQKNGCGEHTFQKGVSFLRRGLFDINVEKLKMQFCFISPRRLGFQPTCVNILPFQSMSHAVLIEYFC